MTGWQDVVWASIQWVMLGSGAASVLVFACASAVWLRRGRTAGTATPEPGTVFRLVELATGSAARVQQASEERTLEGARHLRLVVGGRGAWPADERVAGSRHA